MKLLAYAVVACAALLASCSNAPQNRILGPGDAQSVTKQDGTSTETIDVTNRWIVVFKSSVQDVDGMVDQLTKTHGGQVHYRYSHALKGYAVTLPPQAIEGIKHNPNVDYVEADQVMSINASPQTGATWGLDRVDQRTLPLNSTYTYTSSGDGVTAYIIDTGILTTHTDFGGRATSGWDYIANEYDATDENGHGTHVAGTVGGATYGIAKSVSLVAVRVLGANGSGTTTGVIAGINWAISDHQVMQNVAVANMSLGGGKSTALNTAVANAVTSGITMVVAAGNSNRDASLYSPSSEPTAITVGATTSSDARASYSNYGDILDVFAPGSSITSDWYTSNTATNTISGTSMATPHVTGIAALYLSTSGNSSATPAQVCAAITSSATAGVVGNPGTGSPNLLVYSPLTQPAIDLVHVAAISGSSQPVRAGWTASATVTVHNASGLPVPNATVSVALSNGASGTKTAVTNSTGQCTVTTSKLKNTVGSVTFTVTNITGTSMQYNAGANTVTSITQHK